MPVRIVTSHVLTVLNKTKQVLEDLAGKIDILVGTLKLIGSLSEISAASGLLIIDERTEVRCVDKGETS